MSKNSAAGMRNPFCPALAALFEVARSGELAYQRGTYLSKAQNEHGTLTAATGKFLVVWRKQASGEWKAIVDIDNSDQ
jgi:ketosteroid isomerase-like protein